MAQTPPERKLAAILHADAVGYSRLMAEDEAGTHKTLRTYLDVIAALITEHHGRVVNYAGDAVLADFTTVSNALNCAAAIQHDFKIRNKPLPEERKVRFRIGINLGEVIEDQNDIYGDGVNVAARLESLADPGGICISGTAYDAISGKLALDYEFMGEQQVRNISKPVRAYRVLLTPEDSAAKPARSWVLKPATQRALAAGLLAIAVITAFIYYSREQEIRQQPEEKTEPVAKGVVSSTDKPSIAVLPFTNLSNDPEQTYFSDGLSEDLITDLSRVSGLMVIARTSSFAYRDRGLDIDQIAQALGVRYILEGSVRKVGNRVRINAQLIDAASGAHLWADRYDHDLTDILRLQDEVTETIVAALSVNLTHDEQKLFGRSKTIDPDAYDLLLQGLEPLRRFTKEGTAEARRLFEKAIALDPDFARAHANLALTYGQDVVFRFSEQPEVSIQKGMQAAADAEALDDPIPQLHFALAVLYLGQRNYDAAAASARRSIELDPNYAHGQGMVAQALSYSGELDEAMAAIRKAKRLNPLYPFTYLWIEGHILFLQEHYEEAIPVFQEVISRNPSFDVGRLTLAAAYGQLGRSEEAEWEIEEILMLKPDAPLRSESHTAVYQKKEHLERYIEGLRKAGLPE